MKLGIISDIHSNSLALKVCLDYMKNVGCEEYLLLGDYISDTAQPEETMKLLKELMETYPCVALRGNREDYMIEQRRIRRGQADGPMWLVNSASGNLLYTYERLNGAQIDWFESLPISFVYEKEGFPAITCCHGSPVNTRQLLQLESTAAKAVLTQIDTEYLIAAHTHNQGIMEYEGRMYINPGSLGIAIGTPGYAQCAILNGVVCDGQAIWEPELLNIPYSTDTVVQDIFDSGLFDMAHWFINNNIHILMTGIDLTPDLVELAKKLQAIELGEQPVWPYIDERFFAKAAAKLGIPDYAYLRDEA